MWHWIWMFWTFAWGNWLSPDLVDWRVHVLLSITAAGTFGEPPKLKACSDVIYLLWITDILGLCSQVIVSQWHLVHQLHKSFFTSHWLFLHHSSGGLLTFDVLTSIALTQRQIIQYMYYNSILCFWIVLFVCSLTANLHVKTVWSNLLLQLCLASL